MIYNPKMQNYSLIAYVQLMYETSVEGERDNNLEPLFEQANLGQSRQRLIFQAYMQGIEKLESSQAHFNLQLNLVKHLWTTKGFKELD